MARRGDASMSRARRMRAHGWDLGAIFACSALLALGVALWAVCARSLQGPTATHAQVLSAACCVVALLGWVASATPVGKVRHQQQRWQLDGGAVSLLPVVAHVAADGGGGKASPAGGLPVRTALLVGLVGCALGTLGLLEQVQWDVGVHCALAEAGVRVARLERHVQRLRHDDLAAQVTRVLSGVAGQRRQPFCA